MRFILHKRGGLYAIFWGVRMVYFCRDPLVLTDFYAIRTSHCMAYFGGIFFANMGLGVVRIIFRKSQGQKSAEWKTPWNLAYLQLQRVWWKVAWNFSWKFWALSSFVSWGKRNSMISPEISRHFQWWLPHSCKPCRDEKSLGIGF